jgi:mono/diheme cytochrome c family protein
MKKLFKILLILLLIVAIVGLGGFLYVNSKGIPTYETMEPRLSAKKDSASLARGQKLSMMLCVNCHGNPETGTLSGKEMKDAPPEFGFAYAPNITQDKTVGAGDYSEGQLLYLLRTGIKKDGSYAPPWMPKFPHMADQDIEDIIAFIKSDHPMVQADPTPDKACEPSFLTKLLSNFAFKAIPYPESEIPMPDETNEVEWGRYLVYAMDCYGCHAPDFKTINIANPEQTPGYMSGGNQMRNMNAEVILTSNITPDKESGIGEMSREAFIKALKFGLKDDEHALRYPMMPYSQLSDEEASAIYSYLMQIPPINNPVDRGI